MNSPHEEGHLLLPTSDDCPQREKGISQGKRIMVLTVAY